MTTRPFSADRLRAMYAGGRGDATARRYSRLWAAVFALGLMPRRWVTLEVPGRRSGKLTRFPLGMADVSGQWYLVPMLGERCNWVRNVRAADGRVTLRRRRAVPCRLAEIPVAERAPVIRRYLQKVPGARPHIPVDRHAPLADFETIAPRYPVFRVNSAPVRRRYWWRWILFSGAALAALIIAAGGAFVKLQPTLVPLALPTGSAAAPAGPLDGTWQVTAGSAAGFRVRETVMGFTNDTVGRTTAVTGTMVIVGQQVTEAGFRVDLTAITVNGKPEAQFARSLGTQADPDATITLVKPVTLNPAFASGATISVTVRARLAMHGVSRVVTFPVSGRRDGTKLQLTGAIPVAFAAWHITGPIGFGFLGSLAGHGVAEFLLVLARTG
jgi:YceI-like domain/F420H(2)-dependent quinone reductase